MRPDLARRSARDDPSIGKTVSPKATDNISTNRRDRLQKPRIAWQVAVTTGHGFYPCWELQNREFVFDRDTLLNPIETYWNASRGVPDEQRLRVPRGYKEQKSHGNGCKRQHRPAGTSVQESVLRCGAAAAVLRPLLEVVEMVEDTPAGFAELGARSHPAHVVEGAFLKAEAGRGLLAVTSVSTRRPRPNANLLVFMLKLTALHFGFQAYRSRPIRRCP
jgi:hypothetical protein